MRRIILATAIIAASISAASAVDFNSPIRALDGTPIPISETDKTPVTLGNILETALIATVAGESPTSEEKAKRFFLAVKIHDRKGDLTSDEIALVKKLVGQIYGPIFVGRVTELLDPAAVPGKTGK